MEHEYTELEEVRLGGVYQGRIGIVEEAVHEVINSEREEKVSYYLMNIDGVSGCVVYPDMIDE